MSRHAHLVLASGLIVSAILLLPFLALTSIGTLAPSSLAAQEITWEPHVLEVGGQRHDAELGRLIVPEVRRRPGAAGAEGDAGAVTLAFVRLARRSDNPGPPIVYLDGGPGGSGVGIAQVPAYWRLFDALRDVADVILLSQRGTGLSSPRLVCGLSGPLPTDIFTIRGRMLEVLEPEVGACAETWRERGVDLAGYTTLESADDLESFRQAIGAERLSLLGFSYGTHLALAAMRRHPDRIHRAVLIGTEGLEDTYKLPSALDPQFHHLSALVARDPEGAAAAPDLAAAVDSLLARLDAEPVSVTTDPEGGQVIDLGGDGMRYLLARDLGDTNDHPLWPAAIRLALDGDLRLLAALAGRRYREIAGIPLMGILMDCASGASRNRMARIRAESSTTTLGAMSNLWFPEVCRTVPEARLPDDFRVRFTSTIPTLFLSGTLDSNTPPYQAHHASWGWSAATHIVVDRAGHETLMPFGPAQRVIVDFLRGEDVSGVRIEVPEVDFIGMEEALRGPGWTVITSLPSPWRRSPRIGRHRRSIPSSVVPDQWLVARDRSTTAGPLFPLSAALHHGRTSRTRFTLMTRRFDMFSRRLFVGSLVALVAVVAASCADAPLAPDGPLLNSVPAGHLVAGAGHVEGPAGLREFTFHATENPSGEARGSYKVVLPNGLFFEADVTCMAVEENTGWVAGIIRDTNAGIVVVGSISWFYVIDGGEGEGTEDIVSIAAINIPAEEGVDLAFCADRPLVLPPLVVTQGNVEVR